MLDRLVLWKWWVDDGAPSGLSGCEICLIGLALRPDNPRSIGIRL